MSLAERLAKASGLNLTPEPAKEETSPAPTTPEPQQFPSFVETPKSPAAVPAPPPAQPQRPEPSTKPEVATRFPTSIGSRTEAPPESPLTIAKKRATAELLKRLGSRLNDSSITEADLRLYVRSELGDIIDAQGLVLSPEEKERLLKEIEDDALGLGPLQSLLEDSDITEVMVNGPKSIYVEKLGRLELSEKTFQDEQQLRRVIDRIVSRVGRRVDESSPMVDARLLDGSRVNAIIPPLSPKGSSLTIRKFSDTPLTVENLIDYGTFTPQVSLLLKAAVEAKLNILVSGGTGTGKTTLLNVMSNFIPHSDRIVTVEDALELQLTQDHVVSLETRPPNVEGTGEVTIRDLVKNSLRMRPDRLVVGECRGGEALDMIQAFNTGHDGSLSTIHSNSPRDCVARLETLILMAGFDLPVRAIRDQIASAVDLIVQIQRLRDGSRKITHITEVTGMEGDIVTLQDAFLFDFDAGVDESGRFKGVQRPTGVRPRFTEKLEAHGINFDYSIFEA